MIAFCRPCNRSPRQVCHDGNCRIPSSGSLLIRDVEVQAAACRDRVDQGL